LAQLPLCLYYLGQQIEGSLSADGRHIPLELTGGQCLDHLSWQVVVPAVSGKPLLPAKSASGRPKAASISWLKLVTTHGRHIIFLGIVHTWLCLADSTSSALIHSISG
jgi:hypothetical protein